MSVPQRVTLYLRSVKAPPYKNLHFGKLTPTIGTTGITFRYTDLKTTPIAILSQCLS